SKNPFENLGQASSLTVHRASLPRVSGGRMPPEPADRMSAPHFQTPVLSRFKRRQFLQTIGSLAVGAFGGMLARADELPTNTNPRAIFGDSVEPDWKQRVTITVGPKQADLVGTTDRVIQAAVDYVARRGGGTVHVGPG